MSSRSPSLLSDVTDRTRLDFPLLVADLLRELPLSSPSLHFGRPEDVPLPDSARSLRQSLSLDFGLGVIPALFKDRIFSEAPHEAIDIPASAFYDPTDLTSDDIYALWKDVQEVYDNAAEAEQYGQDKNAWCSEVVHLILRRSIERCTKLQVKDVHAQDIDPAFLPRLLSTVTTSRVDYTFAFSRRDPQVHEVYHNFRNTSPDETISQTTDPFTQRVALFSGFAVKDSNGGNTEALVQLAIWLSAGLEKLSELQALSAKPDNSELLPAIGWTVIGHDWKGYIVFRGCHEGKDRIYVDGPIESLSASTRTYYGIFKLINLFRKLALYAEEVYWPWMKAGILLPRKLPTSTNPLPETHDGERPSEQGEPGPTSDPSPVPEMPCSEAIMQDVDIESLCSDATTGLVEQPPLALVLYEYEAHGGRSLRPIPVDGQKPWEDLVQVETASLETWSVHLGDYVTVIVDKGRNGYAKVSDLRQVEDGRYMVVYTWLYTRLEIEEELMIGKRLSTGSKKHLGAMWPINAPYKYMLSSNRTVTLWDTALEAAPDEVVSTLCFSHLYITTDDVREIRLVNSPDDHWLKEILDLAPAKEGSEVPGEFHQISNNGS
ncbi:hypothetical protein BJY04DRAFT_119748 [Aspergillus karnatakaensis]|uniref:uncharacterized protein n=1 Tax=Aspergillus karnatakaensis TaxID=1810916 RepID=UPI003CCDF012